jgi:excisionase family DNA binding protein
MLLDENEEEENEGGVVSAPLLTVPEAARYLGVGKKIIYNLIETDQLTVVRGKGKQVWIEQKSLDKFTNGKILT